jgi:putative endonuclease
MGVFRGNPGAGRRGERLAQIYLKKRGWRLIACNLRIGRDEVDIVGMTPHGRVMVAVEVRTTASVGRRPGATVRGRKSKALRRVARYLGRLASRRGIAFRTDLLAVDCSEEPPRITHFEQILG